MQHHQLRYLFFAIAILVGIAAGIFLGWKIIPARNVHSEPYTLRIDYKTDYVLMVSELFQQDSDFDMALARLIYLGESPPEEKLLSAIQYADENAYEYKDLQMMLSLFSSIQNSSPTKD